MTATIRRARPDEAPALRELAHRSKAYWPYDGEFLKAVAPMLILEPRHVANQEVHVLELDGRVAGWHRVTFFGERAELEDLWLDPEWIGGGHGRTLFEHAVRVAVAGGANRIEWDAEPYAEGFYRAMGGVEIGRTLPRMRLTLSPPARGGPAREEAPAARARPVQLEGAGPSGVPSPNRRGGR